MIDTHKPSLIALASMVLRSISGKRIIFMKISFLHEDVDVSFAKIVEEGFQTCRTRKPKVFLIEGLNILSITNGEQK
jgi:hypothetical protein